jgi:hypothetical protein
MTNDQWKLWEDSMALAPEITQDMFNTKRVEMTEMESIDLARVLQSTSGILNHLQDGGRLSETDMKVAVETTVNLIAGMYGRLMGLAKAYDTLITKQVVLEAELAASGK